MKSIILLMSVFLAFIPWDIEIREDFEFQDQLFFDTLLINGMVYYATEDICVKTENVEVEPFSIMALAVASNQIAQNTLHSYTPALPFEFLPEEQQHALSWRSILKFDVSDVANNDAYWRYNNYRVGPLQLSPFYGVRYRLQPVFPENNYYTVSSTSNQYNYMLDAGVFSPAWNAGDATNWYDSVNRFVGYLDYVWGISGLEADNDVEITALLALAHKYGPIVLATDSIYPYGDFNSAQDARDYCKTVELPEVVIPREPTTIGRAPTDNYIEDVLYAYAQLKLVYFGG